MQLVERHIIDRNDPRYAVIDEAAFQSKNLYNAALYLVRQTFIFEHRYLDYREVQHQMQFHEAYKALPAKVAQQVLMLLDKNWVSYFEACHAYEEDPSRFFGHPRLPKYKDKTKGRNILVYTLQALSGGRGNGALQQGLIKPSGLPVTIKTRQAPSTIDQVRIVPRKGFYVVEVIYEQAVKQVAVNPAWYAGIDIGTNNLVALASNKPGFVPRIVNGRPVKSVNQFYNKRVKRLRKKLPKAERDRFTPRMERTTIKRTRRIDHYMHMVSRRIINLLVQEGIGVLVIGKNDAWKQEVHMGRRNNQNFVAIPHARLIEMLTYKAELVGITVLITEESYTSKASFLDHDPLPRRGQGKDGNQYTFSGKRVKRGLYQAANGRYINADVQGAYNMIRKVAPGAFTAKGVEGAVVVHPVRIALTKPKDTRKEAKASGQ